MQPTLSRLRINPVICGIMVIDARRLGPLSVTPSVIFLKIKVDTPLFFESIISGGGRTMGVVFYWSQENLPFRFEDGRYFDDFIIILLL